MASEVSLQGRGLQNRDGLNGLETTARVTELVKQITAVEGKESFIDRIL